MCMCTYVCMHACMRVWYMLISCDAAQAQAANCHISEDSETDIEQQTSRYSA